VCLLDVFHKLKKKYNLKIIIAHVNYGLRGKDSEKDERFIRNLAKKYSLPIEIKRGSGVRGQGLKSEEGLRNFRYDFFEKLRKKYQADVIAVGHNLNDQAETVLMRIMRGTGLRGLGAIKFRNNGIIRPLLNIYRKEILAHMRKNKLSFRIDKTNLKADFTRNKIRNKLLPYIAKSFNPNIEEALYKLSKSVADDYDFINSFAREWLAASKIPTVSELNSLHPAIQREVVRLMVEKHNPGLREIEAGHIDEILKIARSEKNKRQTIRLKGLKIERISDKLIISRK